MKNSILMGKFPTFCHDLEVFNVVLILYTSLVEVDVPEFKNVLFLNDPQLPHLYIN